MTWAESLRKHTPRAVRRAIQQFYSFTEFKLEQARRSNPYRDCQSGEGAPPRLAIVENAAQYHQHYVAACVELEQSFVVVDIAAPDWVDRVRHLDAAALLVWPDAHTSTASRAFKEKAEIMERLLGLRLFPTLREVWLHEDKSRMLGWLQTMGVPHPRSWVFHDKDRCLEFSTNCSLPIVLKTVFGASASGVYVINSRRKLRRLVARAFRQGLVPGGYDRWDRQTNCVVLQEYIPNLKEWRLVRIGNSFFGHVKGSGVGQASGSGVVRWEVPGPRHLDFLERVTSIGGFSSMNVDAFETEDGTLLVNELQAVFGATHSVHQLVVDGRPGRFRKTDGEWVFEPGDYARNHCANERVRFVVDEWLKTPNTSGA